MKAPQTDPSFWMALVCLAGFFFILWFIGIREARSAESMPREALQYQRELTRNSRLVWGMDAPVAVLAAQIHQESRWRPNAHSAFASGLAQFTPDTAAWIATAFPGELAGPQPNNPGWALRAIARYDRYLWDRVSGRTACDHMAFTLSAYNGGPGWVSKDKRVAKAQGADPEVWFGVVEKYNAGRREDFFRENRGYPQRILFVLQPLYVLWGPGVRCVRV